MRYNKKKLFIEDVSVENISNKFGTPAYCYSYSKLKENISYLNSVKELVLLEHNYLTSPEKLLRLNSLYFDDELKFTQRKNIKIIENINQINFKAIDINE